MTPWILLIFSALPLARCFYYESLTLTPLPRDILLSSFQFNSTSPPINSNHYSLFPRALSPIFSSTNLRDLHLRFSGGWWDSSWGSLPFNGSKSGGTGVELEAIIEAESLELATQHWQKLSKTLAGYFCASLNSIDSSKTIFPIYAPLQHHSYAVDPNNNLYHIRAALPAEPVCTENLTPFIKLLPTRGKAGLASLLDGHKLYDSLWHSMAIDFTTECRGGDCSLKLSQTISNIVNVQRSIYTLKHGPIPRPTPGDDLQCDETAHTANIWQCFPADNFDNIDYSLETIFGRNISGPAFHNDSATSRILVNAHPNWRVYADRTNADATISGELDTNYPISLYLTKPGSYNMRLSTSNSLLVVPPVSPPVLVSRSYTGYSQDKGGLRTTWTNPSATEHVDFVYAESIPWFLRLYLHTLRVELKNATGVYLHDNAASSIWLPRPLFNVSEYISSQYYRPARDRVRPSHLEFVALIPPNLLLTLTYYLDKALLLYHEYPPDANHGFAIDPAVVTVYDNTGHPTYHMRTASLLVTLPTPDFSMPYNVIILTCTVMSLAFGSLFNLLSKKVVLELEHEKMAKLSKIGILKEKVASLMGRIKGKKD